MESASFFVIIIDNKSIQAVQSQTLKQPHVAAKSNVWQTQPQMLHVKSYPNYFDEVVLLSHCLYLFLVLLASLL